MSLSASLPLSTGSLPLGLAQALVTLVHQRNVDPDNTAAPDWEAQSDDLIEACLALGQNDVLDKALELADELDEAEEAGVYDVLAFDIEYAASHRELLGGTERLSTFLVPLMVGARGGALSRQAHMTRDVCLQVADSFKAHRLVPSAAAVVVAERVYHPEDLGQLSFSQVSRLGLELMARPECMENLSKDGVPMAHSSGAVRVELRFMLVAVQSAIEGEPVFLPAVEGFGEPAFEAYQQRAEAWSRAAGSLICRGLQLPEQTGVVSPDVPSSYYEGQRAGLVGYEDLKVHLALQRILGEAEVFPAGAKALVEVQGDIEAQVFEVRASILDAADGQLLGGIVRAVYSFEGLAGVVDALCDQLIHMEGLAEVSVAEESIFPLVADVTGQPLFRVETGAYKAQPRMGATKRSAKMVLH